MPKSRKKAQKNNIYKNYRSHEDYANDNENEENNDSDEELKQTQIQESQTNNINQTSMIITKSGDIALNSLTIVGQIVIIDNII